ncbi:MAG: hypothetical protein Q9226_008373 [Calogaya cf. arnoldii]
MDRVLEQCRQRNPEPPPTRVGKYDEWFKGYKHDHGWYLAEFFKHAQEKVQEFHTAHPEAEAPRQVPRARQETPDNTSNNAANDVPDITRNVTPEAPDTTNDAASGRLDHQPAQDTEEGQGLRRSTRIAARPARYR